MNIISSKLNISFEPNKIKVKISATYSFFEDRAWKVNHALQIHSFWRLLAESFRGRKPLLSTGFLQTNLLSLSKHALI